MHLGQSWAEARSIVPLMRGSFWTIWRLVRFMSSSWSLGMGGDGLGSFCVFRVLDVTPTSIFQRIVIGSCPTARVWPPCSCHVAPIRTYNNVLFIHQFSATFRTSFHYLPSGRLSNPFSASSAITSSACRQSHRQAPTNDFVLSLAMIPLQ